MTRLTSLERARERHCAADLRAAAPGAILFCKRSSTNLWRSVSPVRVLAALTIALTVFKERCCGSCAPTHCRRALAAAWSLGSDTALGCLDTYSDNANNSRSTAAALESPSTILAAFETIKSAMLARSVRERARSAECNSEGKRAFAIVWRAAATCSALGNASGRFTSSTTNRWTASTVSLDLTPRCSKSNANVIACGPNWPRPGFG